MNNISELASCSFCGKKIPRKTAIIGPSEVVACRPCLLKAEEITQKINAPDRCSFCERTLQGNELVGSVSGLFICTQCVDKGLSTVPPLEAEGTRA